MKKFLAMVVSVVLLATFMVVPALAEKSPEGEVFHKVEIKGGEIVIVKDGETVEVTAKDDIEFIGWEIIGEYEIISGSLTSKNIVVRPLSDIVIEGKYKGVVEEDKEENESDKAPQTGNNLLMATVLLTAAAFVTMVATKKSVKA